MRRSALLLVAAVCLGADVAGVVRAAPPDRLYSFRNNLSDGRLTRYTVRRTLHVSRGGAGGDEIRCVYSGVWTRFHIREEEGPTIKVAQMWVEEPPAEMTVLRNGRESPAPSAAALGLPNGGVRLRTDRASADYLPTLVPSLDPASETALTALLDFCRWPVAGQRVGDTWSNEIESPRFAGRQTLELRDAVQRSKRTYLELELGLTGEFRGGAEGARLDAGEATIRWMYGRQLLERFEGRVALALGNKAAEQAEMQLTIELQSSDVLPGPRAAELVAQLEAFAAALELRRGGDGPATRRACEEFRERWPESAWSAGIERLGAEVRAPEPPADDLGPVLRELVLSLKQWQEATARNDEKELERVRGTLEKLADRRGDMLGKLLAGEDANQRAAAAFALAFATVADPREKLEKAGRDSEARVRAWALHGLALRRDRKSDRKLLIERLADEDTQVRARACQAVAACLPRDCREMRDVRQRLAELLERDKSDVTRLFAARALVEVATAEQLPALRRAAKHETSRTVRERIEAAIDRLSKRANPAETP